MNKYYIPSNLDAFIFDYDHSKFIECNRILSQYVQKKSGPSYRQNIKRNRMISKVTEHISKTLQSFKKHYTNQTEPLSEQKISILELSRSLQVEILNGYKIVIEDINMSPNSSLKNFSFIYQNLSGSSFKEATLSCIDFIHSDLRNVNFTNVTIFGGYDDCCLNFKNANSEYLFQIM